MSFGNVTLACSFCLSKNYNKKKSQPKRLLLKKFCSSCKTQTLHKEEK